MKGHHIEYSDAELFWIHDNHKRPRREAHAEFVDLWNRPDVSLSNFTSLCKRKGWMTGRTGCFKKGQVPPNKGRKGYCAPGSEKGWFKKGERRGVAVELYKPIGTERVSKDGYIERKIHDGMPLQSRWRAVHLIRWEEANGPLPDGHCLKCLDGDKANTAPDNWEAIPRALLPRLSGGRWYRGYDTLEPELRPTALAIAKLEHKARKMDE
ncbi:HNH endonuclease [Salipiger bermudensis]|uniref:Bacteriophage phi 1.45 protein-like protein n=1 Tax=Salipiger bermudensis (strain DSM 26914 / JCM 13377 / KCTC 12554 / HTCC2601) TaxID=314265 RepID=Q0FIB1_SALBH|nr:HNH endonuclease [Salipiger bermudensis]EAU43905.1 Bacteriophage phi 1.45 protein-like protein [Salipiger bermudensis HTCC2601]